MSRLSLILLPKKNREVLRIVARTLGPGARLSGGTALMLQIRHRRSYDLDFFFPKSLSVTHLERKLMDTLGRDLRLLYTSSDQINMEWQDIRISLISFPFPPLTKIHHLGNINITDLRDIASEKVYAIGRREEWRDYADLYAILKNGIITLKQVIKDCEKRFGNGFSSRLLLNQLSAVDKIEIQKLDWLKKTPESKEIFQFFKKVVKDYLQEHCQV
uniref:Nucleotidyl transferase AbiEii/AbiGii toxin family protein n=1 Tax=candidate division WOR-3 bacterium TaxID=2052148 RepID=A0A7C4TBE1_UNCW3